VTRECLVVRRRRARDEERRNEHRNRLGRPVAVRGRGAVAVLADRKGEVRSRDLRGLYPSDRRERGYPAQIPRAGRGLSAILITHAGVCV